MTRTLHLLVLVILTAPLAGCISTHKLVQALARDPATAHISVRSIYFTIEVDRTNPGTGTTPHSVKDGAITVGQ